VHVVDVYTHFSLYVQVVDVYTHFSLYVHVVDVYTHFSLYVHVVDVYTHFSICACSRCVRLSELICIQNVNCVCLSHKYIHCTSIRCKLLFLLFMQKGTYIYIYTAIFLAYFFVNKNENVKLVETVLCSYLCLV